jgi:hypothetical protein
MPDLRGQFLRGYDSQQMRGPQFGGDDTMQLPCMLRDSEFISRQGVRNYTNRGDFLGTRQQDATR